MSRGIYLKRWQTLHYFETTFSLKNSHNWAIFCLKNETILCCLHSNPKTWALFFTNELSLLTNHLLGFLRHFPLKRRKTQGKQTHLLSLLPLNSIHHLMEDKP